MTDVCIGCGDIVAEWQLDAHNLCRDCADEEFYYPDDEEDEERLTDEQAGR